MTVFKAACVQNNATPEIAHNIAECLEYCRAAIGAGADLVALPEYFSALETRDGLFYPDPYPEESHPALPAFTGLARETGTWLLLGSLGIRTRDGGINNRGYLIDPAGRITARYDKIHMFDVNLGEGKVFRESATITPGGRAVVADTPWGGLGLSICYDLRFGALYRALAHDGARILATPAAFAKVTGQAHWHVLNRARAIENGAYVIAPCQHGKVSGGGECFGHSLIVAPWGEVLADGGEESGFILAEIDMAEVDRARGRIPSLTHDREFTRAGAGRQAAE